MDQQSALPSSLHEALKKGELVLTASERAAQVLRHRFNRLAQAEGLIAWQPPSILSWGAWISSLWHQHLLAGNAGELLLNRSQEHALWLSILRNDASLNTLRSLESLASLAADALRITCGFNAERQLQQVGGGSDTRAFIRWASEFDRNCRTAGFLPAARLEARLVSAIEARQLSLPSTLHLVGFDSRTPAQQMLVRAATLAGVNWIEASLSPPASDSLVLVSQNPSSEILSAALWSRNLLDSNPAAQIAIVVPSLDQQRWLIEHHFRQVLRTRSDAADQPLPPAFEFSAGLPLARMPIVSTALNLLRWATGALHMDSVSALLLSHHIADTTAERSPRAAFDAHLLRRSRRLRPEITMQQFHQLLDETRAAQYHLPHLRATLRRMLHLQAQIFQEGHRKNHEEWAEAIRSYLAAAGFAACVDQTRLEGEVHRAWQSVLDELATLSFRGDRVTFDEALRSITSILDSTSFTPQSHHAPIQIMTPAESIGCTFDALWFLNATDLAWPCPISVNPLLPRTMQQSLGVPGADKKLDLERAQATTMRIISSSGQTTFSYASEGAEGAQRSSPLLHGLTSPEILTEVLIPGQPAPAPVPLEVLPDSGLIPLPPPFASGGASVLELQAACGFRAFSELRLASKDLRGSSLGMDAGERGSLVHKSLEIFWQRITSQAALRNLPPSELDSLLLECIEAPLRKFRHAAIDRWEIAYLATQRDRLAALLSEWLGVELSRPPFEVLATETTVQAACGPLALTLRLDRIDRAADKALLIDYKSGPANTSGWWTDRPDAPQLPLYAIASGVESLGGLAFANVRAGKDARITGIAGSSGILNSKGSKSAEEEFEAQLEDWRRVLTHLAEAFYWGDAVTNPKQFPKTCSHCGQRIVCRVDPSTLDQQDHTYSDTQDPIEAHE